MDFLVSVSKERLADFSGGFVRKSVCVEAFYAHMAAYSGACQALMAIEHDWWL